MKKSLLSSNDEDEDGGGGRLKIEADGGWWSEDPRVGKTAFGSFNQE